MSFRKRAFNARRRRGMFTRRRRPWLGLPALGVLIGAVSGCGASDPTTPVTYTSIARHEAQGVARAVVIRGGDLPEFKTTSHAAQDGEEPELTREAKCGQPAVVRAAVRRAETAQGSGKSSRTGHAAGVPLAQRPWVSTASDRLTAGTGYHVLGAYSSVSVMPTPAAADFKLLEAGALDKRCLERAMRHRMSKRLKVRGVVVRRFTSSVKGASSSVVYTTIIGTDGAPLVLYRDSIAFTYGQDFITLTTYHSSNPVPPAMEERLLGLLVARAHAHSR